MKLYRCGFCAMVLDAEQMGPGEYVNVAVAHIDRPAGGFTREEWTLVCPLCKEQLVQFGRAPVVLSRMKES